MCDESTVHRQDGSGEECREVASEVSEETGYLLRGRDPSDWMIIPQHF